MTHKSGKSKGLAYAEFNDAQEASQAVLKLDGTQIDEHTIKVAISNPPQRKEPVKQTETTRAIAARVASLGEAPKPTGPRGRGHSQISLVPRKVGAKTTTPNSQSISSLPPPSTTTTTNTMSNDDFRNMLFSKK